MNLCMIRAGPASLSHAPRIGQAARQEYPLPGLELGLIFWRLSGVQGLSCVPNAFAFPT